ncbi:hypothetical protein SCP_0701740 [Sparassis crispa]|uniref:T6SS Phospholipase effector Tle1-like catalytic domain-containing protein n=1 Tax=Sparassis crispa TaxID=139825 RepID=A0A401GS53_9APHY|nr:hypothetical protein SCP_0701740 [Sparassis crispa]GBE84989.1 hypothetical protein SCP_0701740 [Sparassis crispa]
MAVTASNPDQTTGSDDAYKPRTLILCFDGTADQYDGYNTNVVKLYGLLKKDDSEQLCYYQPGVGTYINPGMVSPLFQWAAKILDEAFACYLDAHVREGYEFLMQTYRPGDKICIFGFSRGAYTARALAGMLHKIGLLPRENMEQIPFAYKLYKKTDSTSLELAAGFKETFCRTVHIEFVGVWETIASVGLIVGRTLPFVTANTTVKTFRQALSLDEHRARFKPNLYHRNPSADGTAASTRKGTGDGVSDAKTKERFPKFKIWEFGRSATQEKSAKAKARAVEVKVKEKSDKTDEAVKKLTSWLSRGRQKQKTKGKETDEAVGLANLMTVVVESQGDAVDEIIVMDSPDSSTNNAIVNTDVLEVWFAGCHSDVGGSAVSDSVKSSLSDITLRWMVREVVLAQCGIAFDSEALASANIPEAIFTVANPSCPPTTGEGGGSTASPDQAQSPSGSSDEPMSQPPDLAAMDKVDALQPLHDELVSQPLWWLLEIVPLNCAWQDAAHKWHSTWSINLGRGRKIYEKIPLFHVTVKERMEDKTLKYTPKAIWTPGTEVYVV